MIRYLFESVQSVIGIPSGFVFLVGFGNKVAGVIIRKPGDIRFGVAEHIGFACLAAALIVGKCFLKGRINYPGRLIGAAAGTRAAPRAVGIFHRNLVIVAV